MSERATLEFAWLPAGLLALHDAMLSFPQVQDTAGIYRFDFQHGDQTKTTYVGETDRLRRRFQHYRTPGPSQRTNVRVNNLVHECIGAGGSVSVQTCTAASIESKGGLQPLDLNQKARRVLLEHAALVLLELEGHQVENL